MPILTSMMLLIATLQPEASWLDEELEYLEQTRISLSEQAAQWKPDTRWLPEQLEKAENGYTLATILVTGCTLEKAKEYSGLSETAEAISVAAFAACQKYRDERLKWAYLYVRSHGLNRKADQIKRAVEQDEVSEKEQIRSYVMDLRVRDMHKKAPPPKGNEEN